MANTAFLTGKNESGVYSLGANPYLTDASHTQAINVPASAKTLVTAYALDGANEINSITLTDGSDTISPLLTFTDRRTVGSKAIETAIAIYDVSSFGAITAQQTTTTSSSNSSEAVVAVLLSEGYLQSASLTGAYGEYYDFSAYNPDSANCSIAQVVCQNDDENALGTLSGVTSPLTIIADITGEPTVSAHIVGAADDSTTQEYSYTNSNDIAKRFNQLIVVFSSKGNPFEGNPNKNIISHNIITN